MDYIGVMERKNFSVWCELVEMMTGTNMLVCSFQAIMGVCSKFLHLLPARFPSLNQASGHQSKNASTEAAGTETQATGNIGAARAPSTEPLTPAQWRAKTNQTLNSAEEVDLIDLEKGQHKIAEPTFVEGPILEVPSAPIVPDEQNSSIRVTESPEEEQAAVSSLPNPDLNISLERKRLELAAARDISDKLLTNDAWLREEMAKCQKAYEIELRNLAKHPV